jgi:plastocyanin
VLEEFNLARFRWIRECLTPGKRRFETQILEREKGKGGVVKLFVRIRALTAFRWMLLLVVFVVPQVVKAQWQAKVGAQSHDKGKQILGFLPNEIWIHAGDSVTWNVETDETHTVTFLVSGQTRLPFTVGCPGIAPDDSNFDGSSCVNGGPQVKGQSFTVHFPTVGNFKLVCLVHANMTGVVHVLDLAESLPYDQSFYDDQAADQRRDLLRDIDHDVDHERLHEHEVTAGTGEIVATPGGSATISVVRFLRSPTVIHVGDTVEWSNSNPTAPHTITFGTEPANPIPPSANVKADADGALHAVINSQTDSAHSGFVVAAPEERIGLAQAPLSVARFRVTFTHPGIFNYICALHDELGMVGKVIVLP